MSTVLQIVEVKLIDTFSILPQTFSTKYVLLLTISLILLYKWSSYTNSSSLKLPPSPPKLPVIGNLHQISSLPHRSLQTLAQRYGPDLMLLHFGSRPVLVVSSAEAASEIFKIHDMAFSDRPKFIFFEKIFYNYRDVVSAPYGEYWRQVRSVCVLNLFSTKRVRSFRQVRATETKLMMSNIEKACTSSSISSSSSVVNLSEMLVKFTNDVVCRVAMGRKYSDTGDGLGRMFMDLATEMTEFFTRVNIGDYIPWLAWVTRVTGFDAKLNDLVKKVDTFSDMVLQEHIDKPNNGEDGDNEDKKDLVDVLLSVQKEAVGFTIDRICIKAIILDIFAGGTDTTLAAIEWTMSELLRNPKVMKKLQKDVRGIVGNRNVVTEDDLAEMHYLKAVTKETFRLHPPFPLLLPRMCNQNLKIKGYNIMANTQVMVSAWAIGRDPKSYTNPERYEPERFLDSDVDYKGNHFELIPFGSGRRGCPGIQFAMVVEELVLANLVHKFDWGLPHGVREEDLDMTETTGVVAHRKYPLKAVATLYKPPIRS